MTTNRALRAGAAFLLAATLTSIGVILWTTSVIALGDWSVTDTFPSLLQAAIGSILFISGCAIGMWTFEHVQDTLDKQ